MESFLWPGFGAGPGTSWQDSLTREQVILHGRPNQENDSAMRIRKRVSLVSLIAALTSAALGQSPAPGVIKSEFIYETAPFPEAHA